MSADTTGIGSQSGRIQNLLSTSCVTVGIEEGCESKRRLERKIEDISLGSKFISDSIIASAIPPTATTAHAADEGKQLHNHIIDEHLQLLGNVILFDVFS